MALGSDRGNDLAISFELGCILRVAPALDFALLVAKGPGGNLWSTY
jgi:hypothetical protein